MADSSNLQPSSLDEQFDFGAGDLSKQFEQLLLTRRLNDLEERARVPRSSSSASDRNHSAHVPRPPYSSQPAQPSPVSHHNNFRNTPLVPCAPQDAASLKFRNLLLSHSFTPTKYENPGLLDEALTHIPIDRIYQEAEEEHNIMKGMAASMGEGKKEDWGYQDCVIRSLLKWFKREFFEFVCNPSCSACHGATVAQGQVPPFPEEQAYGATRVELYRCQNSNCGAYERFPRYSDVWILMKTKRGRAGEFANCFGMLCRAMSVRVRWVWNSEDSVWIEVWSVHKKRWVHVDPCEELWDTPRVYTEGWNRKFAYCIAFSNEGATDVTRRYVRNPAAYGLPRNRCPEECLLWMMYEIRKIRRDGMNKPDQQRLRHEDEREERELQAYVMRSITKDMLTTLPGTRSTGELSDDQKHAAETNRAQWSNTSYVTEQNPR